MASRKFGRPSEVNISSRDLERGVPSKSRQTFGKSRAVVKAENEKRERIARIVSDPSYKSAVSALNRQGTELSRLEAIKRDAEQRKRRLEQSDARPSTYFREYQELNTTITATDRLINTIRRKQTSEQQVKQAIANALISGDRATARELAQRIQSSYISSQDSNQYISGEVSSAARRSKDRSQAIEQTGEQIQEGSTSGGKPYVDYRVAQEVARGLQVRNPGVNFQSTIEGGEPVFKSETGRPFEKVIGLRYTPLAFLDQRMSVAEDLNTFQKINLNIERGIQKINKSGYFNLGLSNKKDKIFGGLFTIPKADLSFTLQPIRGGLQSRGYIAPVGTNEYKRLFGELFKPSLGVVEGSVNLAINPEKSAQNLALALGFVGEKFVTGEGFPGIGKALATDPRGSTARVAGELIAYKGIQYAAVKGPSKVASIATRFSPKYKPVTNVEFQAGLLKDSVVNEQIVKGIPTVGDLGLIPQGKGINIPGISKADLPPTIRGGFGYKASEQAQFIGQKGVVTSQRGLLKLFKKETKLLESEPGFGLFGTPRYPKTGRLATRISRLGESPRVATFKDIIEGNVGFSAAGKPQIIVFPEEVAGRPGGFEIVTLKGRGGKRSSELEVITKAPELGGPKAFRKTGTPAVTVIGPKGKPGFLGGQRVPITTAEFTEGSAELNNLFNKLKGGKKLTPAEELRFTKQTGFKSSELARPTPRLSPTGLLTNILPGSKIPRIPTRNLKFSSTIKIERTPRDTPRITRPTPITRIGPPPFRNGGPPPGRTPGRDRDTYTTPGPPPTRRPGPPPTGITGPPPGRKALLFSSDNSVKGNQYQPGFFTFIIRGGKEVKLPGIRPRGLALKKGATETKQTLAATFGIRRAGSVRQRDINFYPSQKEFRSYRIKQGKKVPTNVFIQKTTQEGGLKGGRLSTKSERRALQLARI